MTKDNLVSTVPCNSKQAAVSVRIRLAYELIAVCARQAQPSWPVKNTLVARVMCQILVEYAVLLDLEE